LTRELIRAIGHAPISRLVTIDGEIVIEEDLKTIENDVKVITEGREDGKITDESVVRFIEKDDWDHEVLVDGDENLIYPWLVREALLYDRDARARSQGSCA
jgi:hypothetical protein